MRQVVVSEARTPAPAYHHPSPRTPRSAPAANPRRSRRRPSRRAGRDASAFDTYVSSAGLNLNPSGRPVTDTPTAIPPGHHVIWSSPAADRATYMQQRMLYGAHPWRSAQPPATGAEAGIGLRGHPHVSNRLGGALHALSLDGHVAVGQALIERSDDRDQQASHIQCQGQPGAAFLQRLDTMSRDVGNAA